MSVFGNFNRTSLAFSVLLLVAFKVVIDIVLSVFGLLDGAAIPFWKVTSSIAIIASFAFFFFSSNLDKSLANQWNISEKFISEYTRLFLLLLFLGLMLIISPSEDSEFIGKSRFLTFLANELVAIISLLIAIYIIWFLFKWLNIRKHKKTSMFMKVIGIGLIYLFAIEIAIHISPSLSRIDSMSTFFYMILGFIVLAISKKNAWIAQLPRGRKTLIFWLSLPATIISFMLSVYSASDGYAYGQLMSAYLPGGHHVFSASLLFLAFYSLRIFWAVLVAFPTSSIVERKSSEVSTLAYLNRFISESASKDISHLLNTVTQLALHASGGSGVWIEVYDDSSKIKFGSALNVAPEAIEEFHQDQKFGLAFTMITAPLLVESVPKAEEFAQLKAFIANANALIAIPLYQGKHRFGTLVVLNSEEYAFEYDDISVLAAFGDNVNIALENSRLLKDSIEKERYLNELMIAKRMQQELLPHNLPQLKNFTISAFTLPAEEVGGDYYDVAEFKDGYPCVLIGDVSGKGMSAAFYMAQLKGAVQAIVKQTTSPKDLLSKVNGILYGLIDRQSYVTMLCVKIEDEAGRLTLARAGHPPAFLKLSSEAKSLTPSGLGIGLAENSIFDKFIEEVSVELNSGDACLLITDGISELRNPQGAELGMEKLRVATGLHSGDSDLLIANITKMAESHSAGSAAHDDMTAVAIVYSENKFIKESGKNG